MRLFLWWHGSGVVLCLRVESCTNELKIHASQIPREQLSSLKWIYFGEVCYSIFFPSIVIWCAHHHFKGTTFVLQVHLGLKKSIECFWWVFRSLVRETGAEYLETLLFPGPRLKWQAMLKSTLLDRQTHQDGRGGQACLTWLQKWYAFSFIVTL